MTFMEGRLIKIEISIATHLMCWDGVNNIQCGVLMGPAIVDMQEQKVLLKVKGSEYDLLLLDWLVCFLVFT